jgi:hypothetical protein
MAQSWMFVDEGGRRRPVNLRTTTREGVRRACRRAVRAGRNVVAGYQGGTAAIALCPKVYPKAQ